MRHNKISGIHAVIMKTVGARREFDVLRDVWATVPLMNTLLDGRARIFFDDTLGDKEAVCLASELADVAETTPGVLASFMASPKAELPEAGLAIFLSDDIAAYPNVKKVTRESPLGTALTYGVITQEDVLSHPLEHLLKREKFGGLHRIRRAVLGGMNSLGTLARTVWYNYVAPGDWLWRGGFIYALTPAYTRSRSRISRDEVYAGVLRQRFLKWLFVGEWGVKQEQSTKWDWLRKLDPLFFKLASLQRYISFTPCVHDIGRSTLSNHWVNLTSLRASPTGFVEAEISQESGAITFPKRHEYAAKVNEAIGRLEDIPLSTFNKEYWTAKRGTEFIHYIIGKSSFSFLDQLRPLLPLSSLLILLHLVHSWKVGKAPRMIAKASPDSVFVRSRTYTEADREDTIEEPEVPEPAEGFVFGPASGSYASHDEVVLTPKHGLRGEVVGTEISVPDKDFEEVPDLNTATIEELGFLPVEVQEALENLIRGELSIKDAFAGLSFTEHFTGDENEGPSC